MPLPHSLHGLGTRRADKILVSSITLESKERRQLRKSAGLTSRRICPNELDMGSFKIEQAPLLSIRQILLKSRASGRLAK